MAAEGIALGAQDDGPSQLGQPHELAEGGGKFPRLHVVRKPPKARVLPAGIDRILLCLAQAAQLLEMHIGDAFGLQTRLEWLFIELRIVPGLGDRSDIHEQQDRVGLEDLYEILDGSGRMTDGINNGWHGFPPFKAK
jgi:hypothetical protein